MDRRASREDGRAICGEGQVGLRRLMLHTGQNNFTSVLRIGSSERVLHYGRRSHR